MLSDEQLLTAFNTPRAHTLVAPAEAHILTELRAVEAAVRADQIKKDAALVEKVADRRAIGRYMDEAIAAIRAQLTEGNGDE